MTVPGMGASAAGGRTPSGPAGVTDVGLSRHQRLLHNVDFRQAYDGGVRFVGRLMVLWVRRGDGAALRLGAVAGKRTFARSVDRSRVRRLMREAYRLNRYRLQGEVDVVLVARRALLGKRRQDAEGELLTLAGKAGLLA